MRQLLCHKSVLVRFLALYAGAVALCYAAWTAAYWWMPEGMWRGRWGAALLAGDDAAPSVALEFLRIALINTAVMLLLVVGPNRLLEVGQGYPLGYVPPLLWSVLYGLLLGSNSFTLPMPARLAPGLAAWGRSGFYEIAAYCLAAASTYGIAAARAPHLLSMQAQPIVPKPDWRRRVHWPGLAAAWALLLGACWWEAYRIVMSS